jgi:hypothetical protein
MSKVLSVRAPQPKAACIPLTPALTVNPASITFPVTPLNLQSPTAVVTVTSTGTAAASISALVTRDIPLSEGSVFNVLDTDCTNQTGRSPVNMVPGASCTATVAMRASATPGSNLQGALDIFANVSSSPTVSLAGSVGVAAATATPLVDFLVLSNPGGSSTKPVTFQNTGSVPITVTNVSLTQFPVVFGIAPGSCPGVPPLAATFTLAPGASCAFDVTFSPEGFPPPGNTPPQGVTGFVQISYADSSNLNANDTTTTALLGSSVGPAGLLSADLSFIFFQDFPQNTSSSTSVTITNYANVAQTIVIASSVTPGVALNPQPITFPIINDLCSTIPGGLAPSASCTFDVRLDRTNLPAQSYAGTVTVTGSAAPASPATISVPFTVIPGVDFAPPSLPFAPVAFPPVAYGAFADIQFTLANLDPFPYTFGPTTTPFALFPPFSQAPGGTCEPTATGAAFTLAAGGSCTVNIRFAPQVSDGPGPYTVNGYVVAPAPSNHFIDMFLAGTASGPRASISPTSFYFGVGSPGVASAPQRFTVTNVGDQPATAVAVAEPTITPPNLRDFEVLNDNCSPSTGLAVNGTCTFDVRFLRANPGLPSGYNSGNVSVTTSPALATDFVFVSGYAQAVAPSPGRLEYYYAPTIAAPLSFPATIVGQPSTPIDISVGNTGGSPLNVTSITIMGDFALVENCTTPTPTLAPGACCTATVTFRPTAAGTRTGTLTIVDSVTGLGNVINLVGVGQALLAPTVAKVFSPNPIQTGGVSTLAVSIANNNAIALTNAAFTDTFPAGLVVAPAPAIANTCGGTATAVAGGTSLALAGGTIPAATTGPGVCSVSVAVTAAAASPGLTNTIPAGGFTTAQGNSAAAATAILVVTNAPVPSVFLSPTSLSFGSQTLFIASAPQTVTLQNVGTGPLNVASVTAAGDFSALSTCVGAPIPPAGQCTINSTFTPIVAGLRTGQISVTSDAPGSPHIVALSGTGVAPLFPNVVLVPATVNFPTTTAGQASAPSTVTLTNSGLATLSIQAIDVIGTGFRLTLNTCGVSVASGAGCTLQFVFLPSSAGAFLADVRIITNSPSSPTFLRLNGTGAQAPQGRITAPAQITFIDQIVNTSSAPAQFTITNGGSATLSIGRMATTGDFILDGLCFDLRVGESCVAAVRFAPTAIGARTGQVVIESNASNPIAGINLSGRGVPIPAPQVSLSATSLSFGNTLQGTGGTLPVTLTNTGGADLAIGSIVALGDYHVSSACPSVVPPGTSCRLDIGFAPSLPGERTGEVRISSNAASSPDTVRLSGVGCRFFTVVGGRIGTLSCSP